MNDSQETIPPPPQEPAQNPPPSTVPEVGHRFDPFRVEDRLQDHDNLTKLAEQILQEP